MTIVIFMYKIKFFKNNNEENINPQEIKYLAKELIIRKTTKESIISLDFNNKKCELKIDDMVLEIPVIEMDFILGEFKDVFNYVLVTEPNVKNTIIIE